MAVKCQECGCVVTQAEADEADHIQNDGLTRCPKCAEATADAAKPEDERASDIQEIFDAV